MDERSVTLLRLARAAIREYLGIADEGVDNARVGGTNAAGMNIRKADGGATGAVGSDFAAQSTQAIIAANPWLEQPGASFVTLTEGGRLRGCIGTLEAYRPLGRDVAAHAVDAAVRDPRFLPVAAAEYPLLEVEVSVLGQPEPLLIAADANDRRNAADNRITVSSTGEAMRRVRSREELERALRPGRDGLIIDDQHGHSATFLPQVWQQLPDPHDFVGHLLAKAGLSPAYDWHEGEIECQRYEVSAYAES